MPRHDLLVIGAGPGGYVAAIRAAQLGLDAACIEREPALGGTCLRIGCIPSKALLESSHAYDHARHGLAQHGVTAGEVAVDIAALMKRKTRIVKTLTGGIKHLFKKNGVTRYEGTGRFLAPGRVAVDGADGSVTEVEAEHVVIATGSVPSGLPGIELDADRVGTSTEALAYPTVPQHLVVIGAGVIGLELGQVWLRLGAKVTVLEYLGRILPGLDGETAALAQKLLTKQGFEFRLGTRVTGARAEGDAAVVEAEDMEPITCDRVLVAVGRRPCTDGLALDAIGLSTDDRGRIPVDEHLATEVGGTYAIGDVIRGPMLAHKAEEEAVACVERIVTGHGHVNYGAIPGVVYTHPEVAGVGATEEELRDAGTPYKKGVFPFTANGRARSMGETDGQVKMLAHAETDRILGVHIIGPAAGELIAELAVSIEFGASAEDIARACHAHPTLAEVVKEAALAVDGRAIHI
jgi:dihydrolipoamide dehydrogenase